ncbi:MAG: pyridoxamine 5'-phosphate oxidase family protein [Planctomycetes bacterium]|nr:pyridoxamine 5'-phosphate oxidase family protein [Planctomycetota bacterium]
MTTPDSDAHVAEFLAACTTASLATVDEEGHAHACNVWYAADARQRIFFVSNPATAHGQHIARDPLVAMTIYAHVAEPSQIHGLQLRGRCEMLVSEADRAEAMGIYAARYPAIAANEVFQRRIEAERFYRVTPAWWRWIDNRRGFGFKVEKQLPG